MQSVHITTNVVSTIQNYVIKFVRDLRGNGELGRDETLSQMQFYLMKRCGASIFKNGYLRHYNFPIEASNSSNAILLFIFYSKAIIFQFSSR
jgi:hypothetical protein